MVSRRALSIAKTVLAILLFSPRSAESQTIRRMVAPGVELTQSAIPPPLGPLLVNVLRVDLKQPGVRVQTELAQDVVLADDPTNGRGSVGSVALRHHAVAAINADYFPYTGDPVNVTVRDGELLSESLPHRVAMALTRDGQIRFDTLVTVGSIMGTDGSVYSLDGINRLTGKDEIVVLTPSFGPRTRASVSTACVQVSGVIFPCGLGRTMREWPATLLAAIPRRVFRRPGSYSLAMEKGRNGCAVMSNPANRSVSDSTASAQILFPPVHIAKSLLQERLLSAAALSRVSGPMSSRPWAAAPGWCVTASLRSMDRQRT